MQDVKVLDVKVLDVKVLDVRVLDVRVLDVRVLDMYQIPGHCTLISETKKGVFANSFLL